MRFGAIVALALSVAACGSTPPTVRVGSVVMLTRDGCPTSPVMRERLDEALKAMGLPANYQVIDSATLHPTDPRSGYPTPTVLYEGRDLFGMPEPQPPFPELTCRPYEDGVPSSAEIQTQLKAASAG